MPPLYLKSASAVSVILSILHPSTRNYTTPHAVLRISLEVVEPWQYLSNGDTDGAAARARAEIRADPSRFEVCAWGGGGGDSGNPLCVPPLSSSSFPVVDVADPKLSGGVSELLLWLRKLDNNDDALLAEDAFHHRPAVWHQWLSASEAVDGLRGLLNESDDIATNDDDNDESNKGRALVAKELAPIALEWRTAARRLSFGVAATEVLAGAAPVALASLGPFAPAATTSFTSTTNSTTTTVTTTNSTKKRKGKKRLITTVTKKVTKMVTTTTTTRRMSAGEWWALADEAAKALLLAAAMKVQGSEEAAKALEELILSFSRASRDMTGAVVPSPNANKNATAKEERRSKKKQRRGLLRIAVCFSGLVQRSLKHTLPSILRIFEDLRGAGFSVDCYYHTFRLSADRPPADVEAVEQRELMRGSGDGHDDDYGRTNVDDALLAHLGCVDSEEQDQDAFDATVDFSAFGSRYPWTAGMASARNYVRRLHSEKRVTDLWLKRASTSDDDDEDEEDEGYHNDDIVPSAPSSASSSSYYDLVMYLRPDMIYERVDTLELLSLARRRDNDDRVYVGDWDHFCGANDRVAVGRPGPMAVYGSRLDGAATFSQKANGTLHSETFLRHHLTTHGSSSSSSSSSRSSGSGGSGGGLYVDFFTLRGGRVRANGFNIDWHIGPIGNHTTTNAKKDSDDHHRVGTFYDERVLCSFEDTLILTFYKDDEDAAIDRMELWLQCENQHPSIFAEQVFSEAKSDITELCQYRASCVDEMRMNIENFLVDHCLPWAYREVRSCCLCGHNNDDEKKERLRAGTCVVCPPPPEVPRYYSWHEVVSEDDGSLLAPGACMPGDDLFGKNREDFSTRVRYRGCVLCPPVSTNPVPSVLAEAVTATGVCEWPLLPPESRYRSARGALTRV